MWMQWVCQVQRVAGTVGPADKRRDAMRGKSGDNQVKWLVFVVHQVFLRCRWDFPATGKVVSHPTPTSPGGPWDITLPDP